MNRWRTPVLIRRIPSSPSSRLHRRSSNPPELSSTVRATEVLAKLQTVPVSFAGFGALLGFVLPTARAAQGLGERHVVLADRGEVQRRTEAALGLVAVDDVEELGLLEGGRGSRVAGRVSHTDGP